VPHYPARREKKKRKNSRREVSLSFVTAVRTEAICPPLPTRKEGKKPTNPHIRKKKQVVKYSLPYFLHISFTFPSISKAKLVRGKEVKSIHRGGVISCPVSGGKRRGDCAWESQRERGRAKGGRAASA